MQYVNKYAAAIKYTADSDAMLRVLQQPEHKWQWLKPPKGQSLGTERLVAADALDEAGRESEAKLLRKPINIAVHNGQIEKCVRRWRQIAFDQGDEAHQIIDMIAAQGPGTVLKHALDNYDTGEGTLLSEPASSDSQGTERNYKEGKYTLAWNRSYGYWALEQEHLLPESQAEAINWNNGKPV